MSPMQRLAGVLAAVAVLACGGAATAQQPEDFPFLGVGTSCDSGLVFGEIAPIENVAVIRADAVPGQQFGHFICDGVGVVIGGDCDLDGQDANLLIGFYGVHVSSLSSTWMQSSSRTTDSHGSTSSEWRGSQPIRIGTFGVSSASDLASASAFGRLP